MNDTTLTPQTPAPTEQPTEQLPLDKKAKKAQKSRFKKEGRRVKGIPAMAGVSPYIMVERNDASNYVRDTLCIDKINKYIKEKQAEGMTQFTLMHYIIAAYLRVVAQRPAINRFIRGQKIYTREHAEICLTIKKEMTLESPDTVVKAFLTPDATAKDVYDELNSVIESYRNEPGGDFDNTAKVVNYIPGVLKKFVIWLLKLLDYFGLLPRFLTKLSPFHCSFFITSMGSLGIPPIYHHLYNFGNCPIFLSFGAKYRENKINDEGQLEKHSYIDFTVVMDERICDGFYFASALKMMKNIARNPWQLDEKPTEVIPDIK